MKEIDQKLFDAATRDSYEEVQSCLDGGASVDARGWARRTPLLQAISPQVAELLLARGADPKAVDSEKNGAIHVVASLGLAEMVEFWLNRGVSVDEPGGWAKQTPLMQSANSQVAALLIKRGADLKAIDSEDNMAIHIVSRAGCLEVLEYLLDQDQNALINAPGYEGRTPLMMSGAIDITELLLARGADVNARDHLGRTIIAFDDDDPVEALKFWKGKGFKLSGLPDQPSVAFAADPVTSESLIKSESEKAKNLNDDIGQTAIPSALDSDRLKTERLDISIAPLHFACTQIDPLPLIAQPHQVQIEGECSAGALVAVITLMPQIKSFEHFAFGFLGNFGDYLSDVTAQAGAALWQAPLLQALGNQLKQVTHYRVRSELESILSDYPLTKHLSTDEALTKHGFRTIALAMHPDRASGNAEDFVRIQTLRTTLTEDFDLHAWVDTAIRDVQSGLYKINLGLKAADTTIGMARLYMDPTQKNFKAVGMDVAQLSAMVSGFAPLSLVANAVSVAHTSYSVGISAAITEAATAVAYMALPTLAASISPHLGIAYGLGMTGYLTYRVADNAQQFYQHYLRLDEVNGAMDHVLVSGNDLTVIEAL